MARRSRSSSADPRRWNVALAALLFCLLVLGGASRADALNQAFERILALILLVAIFWRSGVGRLAGGAPFFFLAGWTALMAIQLIPLPPGLWSALPGREIMVDSFRTVGEPLPWWPISLEPAMTFNSLAAMIVLWAAFALASVRERPASWYLELTILAFLLASIVIGALQVVSGGRNLYFYAITNLGSPVGLFSNRNHNAFMAALVLPLMARVMLRRVGPDKLSTVAVVGLAGMAFAVLVNIMVIGSRMGLILFVVAAAGTVLLVRHALPKFSLASGQRRGKRQNRLGKPLVLAAIGVAAVAIAAFFFLYGHQFLAVSRIAGTGSEEDRLAFYPWVIKLIRTYFPFGSGFGTFPTVFKMIEPDALLQLSYLNHAHNDVLELGIEGGLLAMILAAAFVGAWAIKVRAAWTTDVKVATENVLQARLGSILSGVLLLGSATDYPLRTPACAIVFVISCCWLFAPVRPSPEGALGEEK